MAFCKNCGTEVQGSAKFCTNCGVLVEAELEAEAKAEPKAEEKTKSEAKTETETKTEANVNTDSGTDEKKKTEDRFKEAEDKFKEVMDTPDTTADYSEEDIANNKVMAILAYIGILVLVPIFGAKNSPFAQFHASQGVNLIIAEFVSGLALRLIYYIVPSGLCLIVSLLQSLVGIAVLALTIYGIYNAVSGKAKELPLIGGFKILNTNRN
ncbi:MAG: zinc-ribbon domain-containing protein [Ruminococcaceae bacterium]|nr:zinc-ribbon domain-containing protein [Oscillospiraceae bacterium]